MSIDGRQSIVWVLHTRIRCPTNPPHHIDSPMRQHPSLPPPTAPDFTPVPSASTRHDGWTPTRQHSFVDHLTRIGMVSTAARAVGLSAKSAYALRKRAGAESFNAAWDLALDIGRGHALDLAIQRGVDGVATPVFYRGRQIGVRQVYDTGLLLAALRVMPKQERTTLTLHEAMAALGEIPDLNPGDAA